MTYVLQLSNTFSASDGGPARHALEVNMALNAIGVRTQLVAFSTAADDLRPMLGGRDDYPRTLEPLTVNEARHERRWERLRGADVWVVHGVFLPWVPAALIAAWLLRKAVVIMPHGALTAYDLARGRRKKRVFLRVLRLIPGGRRVFAVATESEKRELFATCPRARVSVVGAGAPVPAEPSGERRLAEGINLLSLSRIAPKKRIDRAIDVLAELRGRGLAATLTVAGSGDGRLGETLKDRAERLGVANDVVFVGQVEGRSKQQLFSRATVFLLLSEGENFGLAAVEALHYGVPVVCTTEVAALESIQWPAGIALSTYSASTAADYVHALSLKRGEGTRAAREYARVNFDWVHVARRWRDTIALAAGTFDSLGSGGREQEDRRWPRAEDPA